MSEKLTEDQLDEMDLKQLLKHYKTFVTEEQYKEVKEEAKGLKGIIKQIQFVRGKIDDVYGGGKKKKKKKSPPASPKKKSPPTSPKKKESEEDDSEDTEYKKHPRYRVLKDLRVKREMGSNEQSLRDVAQSCDIMGRSKMNQEQLIEAIIKFEERTGKNCQDPQDDIPKRRKSKSKEDDDEPPKKKSPSSPKKKVVEEEEKVTETIETEVVETPATAEVLSANDCGSLNREELLEKRIEELEEMLKGKGISKVKSKSKEESVDLLCALERGNQQCGSKNDYACPDGLVCDINTKPGVCVDNAVASHNVDWIEYKGKQIVGNKKAISKLRKKLGVSLYERGSPVKSKVQKYIDEAVKLSGRNSSDFDNLSYEQLKKVVKGYRTRKQGMLSKLGKEDSDSTLSELSVEIETTKESKKEEERLRKEKEEKEERRRKKREEKERKEREEREERERREREERKERKRKEKAEKKSKKKSQKIIEQITEYTKEDPSVYENYSEEELRGFRANIRKRSMIDKIVAATGEKRSKYKKLSEEELKTKYDEVMSSPSEPSVPSETVEIPSEEVEDVVETTEEVEVPKKKKDKKKEEEPLTIIEPTEEEMSDIRKKFEENKRKKKEKKEKTSDEDEEKSTTVPEETISVKEVENILSDVVSGKQGGVGQFSEVQNAVLKCLGLVSV